MAESAAVLDVLVVGAGFAGICAGKRLLDAGIDEFLIVEKSAGIGGTWWENTYPGAACDVPSHLYCFSFAPNPGWSRKFSPRPEIQAYLAHCIDRFGLRNYLDHGRHLRRLEFLDERGLWRAHFADGQVLDARHVILGSGGLHEPKLPEIPGIESFSGRWMHSAQWQKGFNLNGLRVAIVGSAASAIQILPAIAPRVASATLFQRTPNYILPREDRAYSAREKWLFRHVPGLLRLYRSFIFLRMDLLLYPITREVSGLRGRARRMMLRFMRTQVRDPSLHPKLTPDYEMGCKRILISDDFFASFNRSNVELVTTAISGIEESGVRTRDGRLHEVDLIVYATGFDLEGHMRDIDVRGPGGRSLAEQWSDIPAAYNGCCVPGMPNLYLVTGPNTGVGTTSIVFMIEQEVRYILKCIRRAGRRRLLSVGPETFSRYNARLQQALQHTVWASGCHSWYRRQDGRISTLYPWSARRFWAQLRRFRSSDFEIREITDHTKQ